MSVFDMQYQLEVVTCRVSTGFRGGSNGQENSPTTLRMLGPWYGILTGTHVFDFQQHSDSTDQCLFTQSESFTGLLSPFMDSPSSMGGKKTLAAFEEVNRDLAVYAERKWRDAAK